MNTTGFNMKAKRYRLFWSPLLWAYYAYPYNEDGTLDTSWTPMYCL